MNCSGRSGCAARRSPTIATVVTISVPASSVVRARAARGDNRSRLAAPRPATCPVAEVTRGRIASESCGDEDSQHVRGEDGKGDVDDEHGVCLLEERHGAVLPACEPARLAPVPPGQRRYGIGGSLSAIHANLPPGVGTGAGLLAFRVELAAADPHPLVPTARNTPIQRVLHSGRCARPQFAGRFRRKTLPRKRILRASAEAPEGGSTGARAASGP
jgi:hypothetical protein